MTPVDELCAAATLLRERANAATPGPWREEYSAASGPCVIDAESYNCLDSVARMTHYRASLDARYVALMHPPVALALADWLEDEAVRGLGRPDNVAAYAVARAVLRESEQ